MVSMNYQIDNQYLLAIGFINGVLEVRKHRSAEMIHRVNLHSQISNLIYTDYRMEGTP